MFTKRLTLPGGLTLLETILGFIPTGQVPTYETSAPGHNLLLMVNPASAMDIDGQLIDKEFDLARFWSLEQIGISPREPDRSPDESAQHHFDETVSFCNGRYSVSWPWKQDTPPLPQTTS